MKTKHRNLYNMSASRMVRVTNSVCFKQARIDQLHQIADGSVALLTQSLSVELDGDEMKHHRCFAKSSDTCLCCRTGAHWCRRADNGNRFNRVVSEWVRQISPGPLISTGFTCVQCEGAAALLYVHIIPLFWITASFFGASRGWMWREAATL